MSSVLLFKALSYLHLILVTVRKGTNRMPRYLLGGTHVEFSAYVGYSAPPFLPGFLTNHRLAISYFSAGQSLSLQNASTAPYQTGKCAQGAFLLKLQGNENDSQPTNTFAREHKNSSLSNKHQLRSTSFTNMSPLRDRAIAPSALSSPSCYSLLNFV